MNTPKIVLAFIIAMLSFNPVYNSVSQKPNDSAIIIDTTPKQNLIDTIMKLDSVYDNLVDKSQKSSKEILKATIPVQKADKILDKKITALVDYLGKKEDKPEPVKPIKRSGRYTIRNHAVIKPIDTVAVIPVPVKAKKNFWQKIGSLFKSKKQKNDK